jgi:hypothetical protein
MRNVIQKMFDWLLESEAPPTSRSVETEAHGDEGEGRRLEPVVQPPERFRKHALFRRDRGDSIGAEAPGDDVGDARVEEAQSEKEDHRVPGAAPLLSENGERVPRPRHDRQLLRRHGEEIPPIANE